MNVLLLLSCWAMLIAVEGSNSSCIVADIAVQENFNVDKFVGTWNELRWKWPGTHPIETVYKDYKRIFTKTEDDHVLDIVVQARTTQTSDAELECIETNELLKLDEIKSAKTLFNHTYGGELRETDFWILSTDYDTYMVSYTCTEIAENGICASDIETTVWTREVGILSDILHQQVAEILAEVCVNYCDLISIEQLGLCYPVDPEPTVESNDSDSSDSDNSDSDSSDSDSSDSDSSDSDSSDSDSSDSDNSDSDSSDSDSSNSDSSDSDSSDSDSSDSDNSDSDSSDSDNSDSDSSDSDSSDSDSSDSDSSDSDNSDSDSSDSEGNDSSCIVADIAVQENFNVDKFVGTWNELRWKWPGTHPIETVYKDYKRIFTKTEDDHVLDIVVQARTTQTSDTELECIETNELLKLDEAKSARTLFNHTYGGELRETDFWILSTDYHTYMVSYTCTEIAESGICASDIETTVWTREVGILSDILHQQVAEILAEVCVNYCDLISIEQLGLCYPADSEPTG